MIRVNVEVDNKSWHRKIKNPKDKVVIFGTCFTNSHDLELGKAAIAVLEHNNIEYIF